MKPTTLSWVLAAAMLIAVTVFWYLSPTEARIFALRNGIILGLIWILILVDRFYTPSDDNKGFEWTLAPFGPLLAMLFGLGCQWPTSDPYLGDFSLFCHIVVYGSGTIGALLLIVDVYRIASGRKKISKPSES
ncbi:hypothetical protein CMO96_02605 [Candidatus Woesebacteria bacterium]|nr:hypothetical protein [Candidatus Woesebacteria bacterium]|tara:strand:- start:18 stop:416 length:399 start_codon:yes stop_codon:yes gene_type:complete